MRWGDGSVYLLQTVDIITPLVDDPYTFGRIAAANALSDVYAMGGVPRVALNIAAFPSALSVETMRAILAGGADTVGDAGALVVGGHTVSDKTVKFGLSITGEVIPASLVTNAGALPGDRLVLTKPLGTGLLFNGFKAGDLSVAEARAWTRSMMALNRDAGAGMVEVGVHAATDVTGFGLLGHAMQMAGASGVDLHFDGSALPTLPGAMARAGAVTGAAKRNLDYVGDRLRQVPEAAVLRLIADPQTSGGLLIAVAPDRLSALLGRIDAVEVGFVELGDGGVHVS